MSKDLQATKELLDQLNQQIRGAITAGKRDTNYPQQILFVLLAAFFYQHVTKGGFAQLLYNAKGAYLDDMEGMLLEAEASVAHEYYTQAIQACRESLAG